MVGIRFRVDLAPFAFIVGFTPRQLSASSTGPRHLVRRQILGIPSVAAGVQRATGNRMPHKYCVPCAAGGTGMYVCTNWGVCVVDSVAWTAPRRPSVMRPPAMFRPAFALCAVASLSVTHATTTTRHAVTTTRHAATTTRELWTAQCEYPECAGWCS
eukprot:6982705-Prymnesium_polylepis.1